MITTVLAVRMRARSVLADVVAAQVYARAKLADRRRRLIAAVPPYTRLRAADLARTVTGVLHDGLDVAHDVLVAPLCSAAHDAWVQAGRDWERSIGLPDGHPDALFLAEVAPHLAGEPCTCPPDDGPDTWGPDTWGDVSDVTV